MNNPFEPLNPPPRRLMGPGPVDVDPRVLRAMSLPLLGQFDPRFTGYMNEVMALYRQVFRTANRWTLLVDGTARAGIEAVLVSVLEPGDRVLVPVFGRFGHLLCEIARRCRAEVVAIETEWGTEFDPQRIEDAVRRHRPKLVALVQGDTSTTMAQPLDAVGRICREHGALVYVDATASVAGMPLETDAWQLDAVSAGLQKCLSGPPGIAPVTFNDRVEAIVRSRRHVEEGIRPDDYEAAPGGIIQSNYFDLSMLMDYWSESRLNHHTEATSMLYAARECARIVVDERARAPVRPPRPRQPGDDRRPRRHGSGAVRRPGAQDAQRDRRAHPRRRARGRRTRGAAGGFRAGRSGPRSARCTAGSGGSAPWGTGAAATT